MMMHEKPRNREGPLSVFISYAHEDEPLRQRLETHLSLLRRQGLIADWHDRQIVPGTIWAQDIDHYLNEASIILLLISPDFLASDYCYAVEMHRALERHQRGEVCVIPIILRPIDWHDAPFAHLQCLPRDGKPVTEWNNEDAAFREVTHGVRRAIKHLQGPPHPDISLHRHNRQHLLKRVRTFWIEGVLEDSLQLTILISLGLQELPNAIANPWRLIMQETDRLPSLLPVGTHIAQVYDAAEGMLLILGEPGAGKTTLLLELARELLDRAAFNENHPIPVIFNLSSWTERRLPLAAWLVEELQVKYQVPRMVGQMWVDTDQILPLLDGLDEVVEQHRIACVSQINAYHREHHLIPLVVCSRSAEYLAQETRVELRSAVQIQPLTMAQIDAYLTCLGERAEAIRVVLHEDPGLQPVVSTPLMLNVLLLAYQGESVEHFRTSGSLEMQRRRVLAKYVQRMLGRRGAQSQYLPEDTERWLAWLAKQLQRHNLTEFYLERLQPDWLPGDLLRRWYRRIVSRIIAVIVFGLFGWFIGSMLGLGAGWGTIIGLGYGLFAGLNTGTKPAKVFVRSWRKSLIAFLVGISILPGLLLLVNFLSPLPPPTLSPVSSYISISFGGMKLFLDPQIVGAVVLVLLIVGYGLASGLLCGLVGKMEAEVKPTEKVVWSWTSLWRSVVTFLVMAVIGGLLGFLVGGPGLAINLAVASALIGGVMVAMVNRLLFGPIGRLGMEIKPAERVVWSWQSLRRGLVKQLGKGLGYGLSGGWIFGAGFSLLGTLLLGPVVGLLFLTPYAISVDHGKHGLLAELVHAALAGLILGWAGGLLLGAITGLLMGLLVGLILGLTTGLTGGWSSERLDTRDLLKPNQGVWRSARNGTLIGLFAALIIGGLFTGIITGLGQLVNSNPIVAGMISGIVAGAIAMLFSGGIAYIQHFVLRLLLWRAECIPWNYSRFLNYAAERIFLRKVGGGYIFVHRLLLEYFASLDRRHID